MAPWIQQQSNGCTYCRHITHPFIQQQLLSQYNIHHRNVVNKLSLRYLYLSRGDHIEGNDRNVSIIYWYNVLGCYMPYMPQYTHSRYLTVNTVKWIRLQGKLFRFCTDFSPNRPYRMKINSSFSSYLSVRFFFLNFSFLKNNLSNQPYLDTPSTTIYYLQYSHYILWRLCMYYVYMHYHRDLVIIIIIIVYTFCHLIQHR